MGRAIVGHTVDVTARAVGRDLPAQLRLVAVGGACGAIGRYAITSLVAGAGTTLALNVLGSLVLGWLAARYRNTSVWSVAGVGFCGGLTTFSTFALDVANWFERGDVADGVGLAAITIFGAVTAAFAGFALGSRRIGRRA